jgi:hypothetical protein
MAIVFTDTYTVNSDRPLTQHPSAAAPDYEKYLGTDTDILVQDTTDRVQVVTASDVNHLWGIINASVPTGDQEVTLKAQSDTFDYSCGAPAVRASTGPNCYVLLRVSSATIALYRCDNGSFTLLSSFSRTTTTGTTHTIRLRATGTGASVDLECQIDGTTPGTYTDSSANRKTTGRPGPFMQARTTNMWIDDLSVDNLVAGGGGPLFGKLINNPIIAGKLSL